MSLKDIFPAARWLPSYTGEMLKGDLVAGLTVGVMLIPQAMAYAMLAGLPPVYGLYAALVPLLVYPFLGTSRHLAVGIVALDMIIVATGVGALAEPGSERYIELVLLLALMVGVMQVAMGLSRLGFVVILLSRPVVAGFTSAAALIIGFSQLGSLLGLSLPRTSSVFVQLWEVARHLGAVHVWSVAFGLGGLLVLLLGKRWRRVPGPLVAVAISTVLAWWFGMEGRGVEVVGSIPRGLPALILPAVDISMMQALLPTALTLVLVQFMIIISLGKVFANRHNYSIHANRELIAIGAANALGSFFRSPPISGSFGRSALNEQSGARSPLANAVAAVLIGLTLVALMPLFYHLPVPILAAIIIVAVSGLFDPREMHFLLKTKRIDGLIALLTFTATLVIGIQEGILIGIVASVVGILYRIGRPRVALLGLLPGTRTFADLDRHPEAQPVEGILVMRVNASFLYVNAEQLKDYILEESAEQEVQAVVIDASTMNDLDLTAAAMLISVAETLRTRGVALYFGGAKGAAADVMARSGLVALLGEERFTRSPFQAVQHILKDEDAWTAFLAAHPDTPDEAEDAVPDLHR